MNGKISMPSLRLGGQIFARPRFGATPPCGFSLYDAFSLLSTARAAHPEGLAAANTGSSLLPPPGGPGTGSAQPAAKNRVAAKSWSKRCK